MNILAEYGDYIFCEEMDYHDCDVTIYTVYYKNGKKSIIDRLYATYDVVKAWDKWEDFKTGKYD